MGLKKALKQGRYERTHKDYAISGKNMEDVGKSSGVASSLLCFCTFLKPIYH